MYRIDTYYLLLSWLSWLVPIIGLILTLVACIVGMRRRPLVAILSVVGIVLLALPKVLNYGVVKKFSPSNLTETLMQLLSWSGAIGFVITVVAVVICLFQREGPQTSTGYYQLTKEEFEKGWPARRSATVLWFDASLLANVLFVVTLFETFGTIPEFIIACFAVVFTIVATGVIVESHRFLTGPQSATLVLYLVTFVPGGLLASFIQLKLKVKRLEKQFAQDLDESHSVPGTIEGG